MQMLAKHADDRYQSTYGVKADLLECQSRLLTTVHARQDYEFPEVRDESIHEEKGR
jgi:hypothetical protein